MIRHRTRVVHELSHVHLVRSYRFPRFLLTVSFIVTVLGLRLITHGIRDGWLPVLRNVRLGDLHIHHYVWGVLLLLGGGYLSVSYARPRWRHLLAIGYGVGAALVLDELALWLHLDDVYWEPEGEISLVVVVLVAAFLIGVHDLFPFVRALAQLGGRDPQQARPEPDPQGD